MNTRGEDYDEISDVANIILELKRGSQANKTIDKVRQAEKQVAKKYRQVKKKSTKQFDLTSQLWKQRNQLKSVFKK